MRGIPRNALMTRNDFELLQQRARDGELRPQQVEELKQRWQALLNGRYVYQFDRILEDGENPDGSEPDYRVIEEEDESTGEIVRRQYKRIESSTSRLVKLGYTVSDVEDALAELGA